MGSPENLVRTLSLEIKSARTVFASRFVRREHLIADQCGLELAAQVLTHATNTLVVKLFGVEDGLHPLVRSAFEATQDLLFLATRENYDYAGCRLRAAEILDRNSAFHLGADLDQINFGNAESPEPVDDAFTHDIQTWSRFSKDAATVYESAVADVRRDRNRRKYHWSGLSRDQISKDLAEFIPAPATYEIFRAYYTFLSLGTHPSGGSGPESLEIPVEGTIRYRPRSEDLVRDIQEILLDCCIMAIRLTSAALLEVGTDQRESDVRPNSANGG